MMIELRKSIVRLLPVLLIGCSSDPKWQPRDWTRLSVSERQEALNSITRSCRLPADRVRLFSGDEVAVQPHADDALERVECLLEGLTSLRGAKLGFVGNEAYAEEVK